MYQSYTPPHTVEFTQGGVYTRGGDILIFFLMGMAATSIYIEIIAPLFPFLLPPLNLHL